MYKSKLAKSIYLALFSVAKMYKYKGSETVNRVKTLVKSLLLLFVSGLVIAVIMFKTGALIVSYIAIVFLVSVFASYILVRSGYLALSSNLLLFSLFVSFFSALKYDQYNSIYELYLLTALSLILTLIACLLGYSRSKLLLIYFVNSAGLITFFYTDFYIKHEVLYKSIYIQTVTTAFILITVGTFLTYRIIILHRKLLKKLKREKSQTGEMLRITEVYTKKSLTSIISNGGDPTKFLPRGKNTAIQFCDIRDFTTLSEMMDDVDTIRFLNSFFNRMSMVIQQGYGEIDKLIGDCIMSSFNNCTHAVSTALEMAKVLQDYNRERIGYNLSPIHTGTGISYGNVAVGNIGSTNKMDYTLIGDVVNTSSRLESLTKDYGVDIIVSENVYRRIPFDEYSRFLGEVTVKGKNKPIKLYEIFSHETDKIRDLKLSINLRFNEATELYYNKNYTDAARIYNELISIVGEHTYRIGYCKDPILHFFLGKCKEHSIISQIRDS